MAKNVCTFVKKAHNATIQSSLTVFSTHYYLGHTNPNLTHYIGRFAREMGRSASLSFKHFGLLICSFRASVRFPRQLIKNYYWTRTAVVVDVWVVLYVTHSGGCVCVAVPHCWNMSLVLRSLTDRFWTSEWRVITDSLERKSDWWSRDLFGPVLAQRFTWFRR